MNEIMVLVEHRGQRLADISREMLSKGRKLADHSGNALCAVVIGADIHNLAEESAKWADTVIAINDPRVPNSMADLYQQTVTPVIHERTPKLVLLGHSSFGMDLAPALAVAFNAPLATDCTDIALENEAVAVKRSIYGGKIDALHSFTPSETVMVTGRLGQFPIEDCATNGHIAFTRSPFKEDITYKKFLRFIAPEAGGVDITKANVLIAVGRGIRDEKNLSVVEELAALLKGEIAASRPVVDYGWVSNERQVGISGKIVKPDLYIALGISGAIQHVAGMSGSGRIIAVNRDPEAPIFNVADYGVVDDILSFVPRLIERIKDLKT